MRVLLALMFVVFISFPSLAATITYDFGTPLVRTPTASQVVRLTEFIADVNAERAAQVPPLPALTIEEYLDIMLVSTVGGYVKQAEVKEAKDACANYAAATTTVKNQVKSALGGKNPCP